MPRQSIETGDILAFGNFSISSGKNGEMQNAVALRLDWNEASNIIQQGEPDLFLALQWRYNLAPTLRGRDQDLKAILDWAEGGDGDIQIRLLSGGGGSGKTRLAATAAKMLRARGWAAGFLPRDADETHVIVSPVGERVRKLFLIIDYPEERIDVVEKLIRAMRDIDDELVDFPIRILLVSRRDLGGWRQIMEDMGHRAGRQELAVLNALSLEEASGLFEEAAHNFTQLMGRPLPDLKGAQDWLAVDTSRRVPLVVIAAALHQVMTGQGGFGLGAYEVIEALAKFERTRAEKISKDLGLGEGAIPRLLALAAMSDKGLSSRQCKALAELGVAEQSGQSLIDRLAKTPWYQQSQDGKGHMIRPEPDRMAAVFLGLGLLERVADDLPEWIAVAVAPDAAAFGGNLSRIGFDLLNAPQEWSQRLEVALGEMIAAKPDRAGHFLGIAMQEASVFSAGFAVVILQTLLALGTLEPQDRATLLNNLALHLSVMGHREEAALKAAEDAVALYRDLASARPEAFTPYLAGSLNNMATMLSELGRREEALKAAQDAVALYRDLASARPEAFAPDLAGSLNNMANRLSELGRREEALKAAQEAVTKLRPFFLASPQAYMSRMATIAENYLKRCQETGTAPDIQLLQPIVDIFEHHKLQRNR